MIKLIFKIPARRETAEKAKRVVVTSDDVIDCVKKENLFRSNKYNAVRKAMPADK